MVILKKFCFSILTSEMEVAGINWSSYQFVPCFIHKLLRYDILRLNTFRQKCSSFNSMTALFMTSVQIFKFFWYVE